MIKIAYFSLDDTRLPSPVMRVLAPNSLLRSQVELLNAYTMVDGLGQGHPQALRDADVVLVQRGFPRRTTKPVCDAILSSGKPIIYETDDAIQHLPKHHNKPFYDDDVGPAVEAFARQASLVTVATAPLMVLFSPLARQVAILPNYLSPDLWTDDLVGEGAGAHGKVRIGFVGSMNHDRDFATLVPLLREALSKYENVELVSYGGLSAGLEDCPRFSTIPAHYVYAEHPRRLAAAGIDIAIAPLTPSRFNRCKSNIKFLEFGFLGIPGVFAALEPYRSSVRHGETGFLCDERPSSWREALFSLIEDANLRRRVGVAAREVVRSSWMLDAHAEQWLRAYDLAMKAAKGEKTKAR